MVILAMFRASCLKRLWGTQFTQSEWANRLGRKADFQNPFRLTVASSVHDLPKDETSQSQAIRSFADRNARHTDHARHRYHYGCCVRHSPALIQTVTGSAYIRIGNHPGRRT